jgi:hypothetical protein
MLFSKTKTDYRGLFMTKPEKTGVILLMDTAAIMSF